MDLCNTGVGKMVILLSNAAECGIAMANLTSIFRGMRNGNKKCCHFISIYTHSAEWLFLRKVFTQNAILGSLYPKVGFLNVYVRPKHHYKM
jgi:hypothetical protein